MLPRIFSLIFTLLIGLDLDVVHVGDTDTCGTYVFEVNHLPKGTQLRHVVFFAREQLLQEAAKKNFNVLLLERWAYLFILTNRSTYANKVGDPSWNLTLYRRGKQYRVEVRYNGRPAHALGKIPSRRPPPFIRVLEGNHLSL